MAIEEYVNRDALETKARVLQDGLDVWVRDPQARMDVAAHLAQTLIALQTVNTPGGTFTTPNQQ